MPHDSRRKAQGRGEAWRLFFAVGFTRLKPLGCPDAQPLLSQHKKYRTCHHHPWTWQHVCNLNEHPSPSFLGLYSALARRLNTATNVTVAYLPSFSPHVRLPCVVPHETLCSMRRRNRKDVEIRSRANRVLDLPPSLTFPETYTWPTIF